jgi:hypothetical protein
MSKKNVKTGLSDEAMQCRAPRCRQRSGGPRFKFMCAKHRDANVGFPKPVKMTRKKAA